MIPGSNGSYILNRQSTRHANERESRGLYAENKRGNDGKGCGRTGNKQDDTQRNGKRKKQCARTKILDRYVRTGQAQHLITAHMPRLVPRTPFSALGVNGRWRRYQPVSRHRTGGMCHLQWVFFPRDLYSCTFSLISAVQVEGIRIYVRRGYLHMVFCMYKSTPLYANNTKSNINVPGPLPPPASTPHKPQESISNGGD